MNRVLCGFYLFTKSDKESDMSKGQRAFTSFFLELNLRQLRNTSQTKYLEILAGANLKHFRWRLSSSSLSVQMFFSLVLFMSISSGDEMECSTHHNHHCHHHHHFRGTCQSYSTFGVTFSATSSINRKFAGK